MLPSWMTIFYPGEFYSWIDIHPINPLALIILPLPLIFLRMRGKNAGYLLCFCFFFLYSWAVCAYAICPIPINPKVIGWLGCTESRRLSLNLLPTFFSSHFDIHGDQVYGNFLLGLPFGLGLPFVASKSFTLRRALTWALGFAAGLELAQLFVGFIVCPYRSIDIDDVLLVFAGTLAGYGALWAAAQLYRRIAWTRGAHLPVWDHIHSVLLRVAAGRASPAMPTPSSTARNPPPVGGHPEEIHDPPPRPSSRRGR